MPLSFPANPTLNQTYTYNGVVYTFNGNLWTKGSAGGASITVSSTAPSSPSEGTMWLHSETGDLYVYAGGGWVLSGGGGGGGGGVAAVYDIASTSTGYFSVPVGTTDQRPATAANGMIRFNSNIGTLEQYALTGWQSIGETLPIITDVTGLIRNATEGNIIISGTNFGTLQGTLRFNFANVITESYILPSTTTSITVPVPSAVYQLSAGVVGNILWIKTTGETSNSYAMTVQPPLFSVQYLVVAGGGGGGNSYYGAGGGGGGFRTATDTSLQLSTPYTVTVGSGGATTVNGSNSVFNTITSTGGGAGATSSGAAGNNGGSGGGSGGGGGGGSLATAGGTGNTPATIPSQGNDGGRGWLQNYADGGGGGGGAGAIGGNGSASSGGAGGIGATSLISGALTYYAGGGGGSAYTAAAGPGGTGGGGAGGRFSPGTNGTSGTVNTGGGGGAGGGNAPGGGAAGGSGIVILKFPAYYSISVGAGLTSTSVTSSGYKVVTFTAGTGTVTFS